MEIQIAKAPGYDYFVKRFGKTFGKVTIKTILRNEVPNDRHTADYLTQALPKMYDRKVAAFLAAASTWAYSDAYTMARMLRLHGIPDNRTVSMTLKNDALFLDTTAHVVTNKDGSLVILCFGGTHPLNGIQLLLDASVKPDSFFGWGFVHGGFFRAFETLWALPKILIEGAASGLPVCDLDYAMADGHRYRSVFEKDETCDGPNVVAPSLHPSRKMKALYITGHSLGGALAVLAAAAIHTDPELIHVKHLLRGVYTFGQPMVGDETFAATFDPLFGDSLFRHVYADDPVPRLPPKTTWDFVHFGKEYRSEETKPWQLQKKSTTQATNALFTLVSALVGLMQDQFPPHSWLPNSWLHGGYSFSDHIPLNYLRASLQSAPGSEFRP